MTVIRANRCISPQIHNEDFTEPVSLQNPKEGSHLN